MLGVCARGKLERSTRDIRVQFVTFNPHHVVGSDSRRSQNQSFALALKCKTLGTLRLFIILGRYCVCVNSVCWPCFVGEYLACFWLVAPAASVRRCFRPSSCCSYAFRKSPNQVKPKTNLSVPLFTGTNTIIIAARAVTDRQTHTQDNYRNPRTCAEG